MNVNARCFIKHTAEGTNFTSLIKSVFRNRKKILSLPINNALYIVVVKICLISRISKRYATLIFTIKNTFLLSTVVYKVLAN